MAISAETKEIIQELDEQDVLDLTMGFLKSTTLKQQALNDQAEENENFYRGKHWDPAVRSKLEGEGKPVLTINHILPIVNFYSGVQRQNPRDVTVHARRGGQDVVAEVLTHLTKHAMDVGKGDYAKNHCFTDGTKKGRSWLHLDTTMLDDPINGRLVMTTETSKKVILDPNCEDYNINDIQKGAKFVLHKRWEDKEFIELSYENKLGEIVDMRSNLDGDGASPADELFNSLMDDQFIDPDEDDLETKDRRKHQYRTLDVWFRRMELRTFLIDLDKMDIWTRLNPADSDYKDQLDRAKEVAQEEIKNLAVREELVVPIVHYAKIMGNVVLEHVADPFDGYNVIPYFRYSPFWDEDYEFSVIENLISPQNEENKRRSQVLHLLNQTANSGWLVRKIKGAYDQVLKMFGSTPGVIIEEEMCGGKAERIQPNRLSEGHLVLAKQAPQDMQEISGVSGASMGANPSREESGRMNEVRQRQGLTVNEIVFDNFDYTVELFAEAAMHFIRNMNLYSKEEIMNIVGEDNMVDENLFGEAMAMIQEEHPPPQQPDPAMLPTLSEEEQESIVFKYQQALQDWEAENIPKARDVAINKLLDKIDDWGTGVYGVRVTQSASAPTTRIANFLELIKVAESNPGLVPPELLVEATGLPQAMKSNLIEGIEKQRELMAQQTQQ